MFYFTNTNTNTHSNVYNVTFFKHYIINLRSYKNTLDLDSVILSAMKIAWNIQLSLFWLNKQTNISLFISNQSFGSLDINACYLPFTILNFLVMSNKIIVYFASLMDDGEREKEIIVIEHYGSGSCLDSILLLFMIVLKFIV